MSRVLVIDDEAGYRKSMSRFFEMDGFEVKSVANADEALTLLGCEEFDAVVTDIILPTLSGVDLLERIRALRPELPVVLLTGRPTLDTAIKAVKFGAADYLTKPFSREELISSVRKALAKSAAAGERRGPANAYLAEPDSAGPSGRAQLTSLVPGETEGQKKKEVRICIVDDEPDIVEIVERMLGSKGYVTFGLTDIVGVSLKIKRFRPHIIIIDVNMPAIRGPKLLELLKQNLDPMPKVIFFSGDDPQKLEALALQTGADDFVYKGDGFFRLLGRVNLHVHDLTTRGLL